MGSIKMKELIKEVVPKWEAHEKIRQRFQESQEELKREMAVRKEKLAESLEGVDVQVDDELRELFELSKKLSLAHNERWEMFRTISPFLNYNLGSKTHVLCELSKVKLVAGKFGLGIRQNVQSRPLQSYEEFKLFVSNKEEIAEKLNKIDTDYCAAFEQVCDVLSGYLDQHYEGVEYKLNQPVTVLSYKLEPIEVDVVQMSPRRITLSGEGLQGGKRMMSVTSSNRTISGDYAAIDWHSYTQLRPHLEYMKVRMRNLAETNIDKIDLKQEIQKITAKWVLMASI